MTDSPAKTNPLVIKASAPSNIALIKYMGKISAEDNRPTNDSLSYTLEHLRTYVEISTLPDGENDKWSALVGENLHQLELSEKSQMRFLKHLKRLKDKFGIQQSFHVKSANNFPSDCGIASSASSFAALTLAATQIFAKIDGQFKPLATSEISELSRMGSGSSCRSFFSPWSLWSKEGARALEVPISIGAHQVVIVESGKKLVSSSEAHQRVTSSMLFKGRPERAEQRLQELLQSFKGGLWQNAFEITWAEFWDMHALFETSIPSFGYMDGGSLRVLTSVREYWQKHKDGPLVTMDAGANIHLMYRMDQLQVATELGQMFAKEFKVFDSILMTRALRSES